MIIRVMVLLIVLCTAQLASAAGPRLVMHYFFDQDKTELHLIDLKFPSAKRGIAAGIITDGKRTEPTLLITSDAGTTWSLQSLKEVLSVKDGALSLHFIVECAVLM